MNGLCKCCLCDHASNGSRTAIGHVLRASTVSGTFLTDTAYPNANIPQLVRHISLLQLLGESGADWAGENQVHTCRHPIFCRSWMPIELTTGRSASCGKRLRAWWPWRDAACWAAWACSAAPCLDANVSYSDRVCSPFFCRSSSSSSSRKSEISC